MKKIKWKTEKRLISELNPYHKNPRQMTKDQEGQIRESIDEFGLVDLPSINLDNTIIGGHQRIAILKKEEVKEIEVRVPSRMLTEKEIEKLNVRLNKNHAEWDWDILANEFEIEDLLECGFSEQELHLDALEEDLNSNLDNNDSSKAIQEKKCPNCGFIYADGRKK